MTETGKVYRGRVAVLDTISTAISKIDRIVQGQIENSSSRTQQDLDLASFMHSMSIQIQGIRLQLKTAYKGIKG